MLLSPLSPHPQRSAVRVGLHPVALGARRASARFRRSPPLRGHRSSRQSRPPRALAPRPVVPGRPRSVTGLLVSPTVPDLLKIARQWADATYILFYICGSRPVLLATDA